jgi:hypothetical protein
MERNMSRKMQVLSLSIAGVCGVAASSAFAQMIQPGNVWPNADLSVAAPPGVDQVYSYYNTPFYTPNAVGDTNPRPDGWHRGGGDFATTTTPQFLFYNTPGDSAGEGTAPAGLNGYALEVSDSDVNNYGEWFSDWNALPPSVLANPGETFDFRFYYETTGVEPRGDNFRVSVDWGDSVGDDVLTAPNQIGPAVDFLIPGGSPDVTTWTEVDELLSAPVGAQSMRVTVDSGGTSAATGNIWVGDISVAEVPEPTCIAAMTAGSMLLLARRRRRA